MEIISKVFSELEKLNPERSAVIQEEGKFLLEGLKSGLYDDKSKIFSFVEVSTLSDDCFSRRQSATKEQLQTQILPKVIKKYQERLESEKISSVKADLTEVLQGIEYQEG